MRLPHQRVDEGPGRVDMMAVEAEIELAPLHPLDPEPVDQPGRRRLAQGFQHAAPAADLHLRAAVQRPGGGVQPLALVRVQRRRPPRPAGRGTPWPAPAAAPAARPGRVQRQGGVDQPLDRIGGVAFQACRARRRPGPGHRPGSGSAPGSARPGRAGRRHGCAGPSPGRAKRGRRARCRRPSPAPPRPAAGPRPGASARGRGWPGARPPHGPAASGAGRSPPARSGARRRRNRRPRTGGAPRRRRSGWARRGRPPRPAPPGSSPARGWR